MRLIGINGRLRSGKDTAVKYLRYAAAPARVERAGFADKLKLSAALALGAPVTNAAEAIEWCNRLKDGSISVVMQNEHGKSRVHLITGREYQQFYGTEAHRNVFDPDFWVNALLPEPRAAFGSYGIELESRFPDVDVLLVTDVRFPNEAERILNLGGDVWKIDADKRLGPLPPDAHPSEHGLPNEYLTLVVPNNNTEEQFDVALQAAWRMTNG